MSKDIKVLVCQHGARHRYAIPRMLEDAGMLAALYTDSSVHSLLGRVACWFCSSLAPKSLQRLALRKIKDVERQKIYSSDAPIMFEFFQKLRASKLTRIEVHRHRHRILSKKMINKGLRGANILYSMYYENLDFVKFAKDRGLKIVIDVFIHPGSDCIVSNESSVFPDWSTSDSKSDIRMRAEMWQETALLADILLCPSEWVAEGVRELSPEHAHKIRIVPYGCSIDYQGRVNSPIKGRIFFAGGDPLRKGLHYLAGATTLIKKELPELDVRIAGVLDERVKNHPTCKDLNFLGKLTIEQMKDEFLSADCFVFPSLSEGFAGVVAEAIGAGCPVIVTKESGSPVVNEREGLIIPSKDVVGLKDAMARMILDRDFRGQCADNCLAQKIYYGDDQWANRLIEALNNL